jgi:inorganic pyrophosphatase
MTDEAGADAKILTVLERDPRFEEITELADVPNHLLREIENFFATYKALENKPTATLGWSDRQAAMEAVVMAERRWQSLRQPSHRQPSALGFASPLPAITIDGRYG